MEVVARVIREGDKMTAVMKPLAHYMEEAGITPGQVARATGLDARLVKAIASGNFTPSPSQRQSIAAAVGVPAGEISWEHAIEVQHLRGNGPQCGRPT